MAPPLDQLWSALIGKANLKHTAEISAGLAGCLESYDD
jgi:hypothetical protein